MTSSTTSSFCCAGQCGYVGQRKGTDVRAGSVRYRGDHDFRFEDAGAQDGVMVVVGVAGFAALVGGLRAGVCIAAAIGLRRGRKRRRREEQANVV